MVSSSSVKLSIDCQEVGEKELKEAGNTSTDGYQVLGKMSKSIGSKGESATMFDMVCSLAWGSRDRCCDLPSTGAPGTKGPRGERGETGPAVSLSVQK
ncbi:hypothetical protein NL108_014999 [Boleophthalmus pectinirostris]|nr:hypothetical protein NL108_014999 [Boleophthalmus pectinirostris]